jgi:hypothetical protein
MAEAGGWLFIGGLEVALGLERWRIEKRSAVTGQLDPTWPYGGSISWDISPGPDRLWSLRAVGPHLFLAGETQGAQVGEQEWLILKITWSDGLPVAEFGTNGQLQENVGPSGNAPFAMADDGTALYVAGHAGGAWRVEKRDLVTGEFVPEFNGGTVTLDPSPALDIARAIAVADGSLFVGGEQQAPDGYRGWRVQKFDATTGATSMSFGTDGAIVHSAEGFGPDTAARSIVVDGGNLYLGGEVGVLSRLEKRTTDKGKLVPTFGDSGVILGSMRSIYSLALDADSVYAAGHHLEGNNLIEAIEKRTK